MSLSETVDFDKDGEVVRFSPIKRLFLSLVIILVAVLSYGLGRLGIDNKTEPIQIEYAQTALTDNLPVAVSNTGVFASSKGSKYYYPGCSNTISEANKVTFSTPKQAEAAGYTLAANCRPK